MQAAINLKDYYLFDNFINLTSNTQSIITAKHFADSPVQNHNNILVITGIIGCGKTHLAMAILTQLRANKPNAAIYPVSYERWWADFRQRDSDIFFDIDFLNQQDIILIDSYYPLKMDTPDEKRFQVSFHEMLQKMVALNIIRNKIVSRIFATVKRGTPYVELGKFTA